MLFSSKYWCTHITTLHGTHDRCSKPFIQFVFLSITHNTNIRSMYMMVEDSTPAVSLYILHKKCNFSDIFWDMYTMKCRSHLSCCVFWYIFIDDNITQAVDWCFSDNIGSYLFEIEFYIQDLSRIETKISSRLWYMTIYFNK